MISICPGSDQLNNKFGHDIVTATILCPVCERRVSMGFSGLNDYGVVSKHLVPHLPWDEVMQPLADSPLWLFMKRVGAKVIEHRMHEMGDYDSGISSSDVNHTIFGTASMVYRYMVEGNRDLADYPAQVLHRLMDEGGE